MKMSETTLHTSTKRYLGRNLAVNFIFATRVSAGPTRQSHFLKHSFSQLRLLKTLRTRALCIRRKPEDVALIQKELHVVVF
jgi:hypothetical protein